MTCLSCACRRDTPVELHMLRLITENKGYILLNKVEETKVQMYLINQHLPNCQRKRSNSGIVIKEDVNKQNAMGCQKASLCYTWDFSLEMGVMGTMVDVKAVSNKFHSKPCYYNTILSFHSLWLVWIHHHKLHIGALKPYCIGYSPFAAHHSRLSN